MSIFSKVFDRNYICKLYVSYQGETKPLLFTTENPDAQYFYNDVLVEFQMDSVYFGKTTISLSEQSVQSDAGTHYKQKVTFRFPSNDKDRSKRLKKFEKVKYIILELNDGRQMIIGRNDIKQNAPLRPIINSNTTLTNVEINSLSIFPMGFINK